ncbi:MAG TPA: phage tail protein [Kofleriaceae bacterium]|nr:phage tail protein [Kofleriaceae bacterium]
MTRNSYAAGHFELRIDGHEPTAFVRSVEGGWSRAHITDDVIGSNRLRIKQITSVEIDPITVEVGLTGSRDMLRWIQRSWNGSEHQGRNGQITYADFDMRAMFEHQFTNALLVETTFPALDGASREGGYITCKLQPESVATNALSTPGARIQGVASALQKMWTPAAFRINIDGIPDMRFVNRLDPFTVTLQTKKFHTGRHRLPEIVPLQIKFPNLTGTISLKYADSLIRWHKEYIRSIEGAGIKDTAAQKHGSIEFLSSDRSQTLFQINLTEVGLTHLCVEPAKANAEQIKRLKFELYVQKMSVEGSGLMGFA